MSATVSSAVLDGVATITLEGELDARSAPELNEVVNRAVATEGLRSLVLDVAGLSYMSSAGVRCLVFAHQKLAGDVVIELHDVRSEVAETIRLTGFDRCVVMHERSDDHVVEGG